MVPEVEKLFDDDADARKRYWRSCAPLLPTWRLEDYRARHACASDCSGLTSLKVRKDSLLLLGQISVKAVQLLPPFTNKILQNILGLLDKASLFNSNASNKGKSGGASIQGYYGSLPLLNQL